MHGKLWGRVREVCVLLTAMRVPCGKLDLGGWRDNIRVGPLSKAGVSHDDGVKDECLAVAWPFLSQMGLSTIAGVLLDCANSSFVR